MNGKKFTVDANEYVTDEILEKLGYTHETFQDSMFKLFLESLINSSEEIIHEETEKLMREYSLSYGEARGIAVKKVIGAMKINGKK